jgi:pimeloyl-ACP methyl ester carboxylesterase
VEQYRLARLPGFLKAALSALRAQLDLRGQREVMLDRLAHLEMPTLLFWGAWDRVFPPTQAHEAAARMPEGTLVPDCGHMPHVERPDRFVACLEGFLGARPNP